MDFATTITHTNFSVFPLDLKTINNVMEKILMYVILNLYGKLLLSIYIIIMLSCLYRATEKNSSLLKLDDMKITEVTKKLYILYLTRYIKAYSYLTVYTHSNC